jgi:hypothetical protein
MAVYGDALRGTRPWVRAEGRTGEGLDVRYNQAGGAVHAVVLGSPEQGSAVTFPDLAKLVGRPVELLGHGPLTATLGAQGSLRVEWPGGLPDLPAHALRVGP